MTESRRTTLIWRAFHSLLETTYSQPTAQVQSKQGVSRHRSGGQWKRDIVRFLSISCIHWMIHPALSANPHWSLQRKDRRRMQQQDLQRVYFPNFDLVLYLLVPIPCHDSNGNVNHYTMTQQVRMAAKTVLEQSLLECVLDASPSTTSLTNVVLELGQATCGNSGASTTSAEEPAPSVVRIAGGIVEYAEDEGALSNDAGGGGSSIPSLLMSCFPQVLQSSQLKAELLPIYAFLDAVELHFHTPSPTVEPTTAPPTSLPTPVPTPEVILDTRPSPSPQVPTAAPVPKQDQETKSPSHDDGDGQTPQDNEGDNTSVVTGLEQGPSPSQAENVEPSASDNGFPVMGIVGGLVSLVVLALLAFLFIARRKRGGTIKESPRRLGRAKLHSKAIAANQDWRRQEQEELNVEDSSLADDLKEAVVHVAQKASMLPPPLEDQEDDSIIESPISKMQELPEKNQDPGPASRRPSGVAVTPPLHRRCHSSDEADLIPPRPTHRSSSTAGRVDQFLAASLRALSLYAAGGGGDDADSGRTPTTGQLTEEDETSYSSRCLSDVVVTPSTSNSKAVSSAVDQGTLSPIRQPVWSSSGTEMAAIPLRRTWSAGATPPPIPGKNSSSRWMDSAMELLSWKGTLQPNEDAAAVIPNLTLSSSGSFSSSSHQSSHPENHLPSTYNTNHGNTTIPTIPLRTRGPTQQQSLSAGSGHRRVPTPIGEDPFAEATSNFNPTQHPKPPQSLLGAGLQSYSVSGSYYRPTTDFSDDDDTNDFAPDQNWDFDDASLESGIPRTPSPAPQTQTSYQSRAARYFQSLVSGTSTTAAAAQSNTDSAASTSHHHSTSTRTPPSTTTSNTMGPRIATSTDVV